MGPACSPLCLVVQRIEPEGPHLLGRSLPAAGIGIDLRRVHLGNDVSGVAAEQAKSSEMSYWTSVRRPDDPDNSPTQPTRF